MGFSEAVKTCFSKYVDFTGRAARSEYWFWVLFVVLAQIVLTVIDQLAFSQMGMISPLVNIFALATLLPGIAVTARRLHDRDRSGWWQLIVLIPLIGWIVMLIWVIPRGTEGENRFGPDPLAVGEAAPAAA